MRLNAREVELLSQLDLYQTKRRRSAWIALGLVLVSWAVLVYLDMMTDQLQGMVTVLWVIALSNAFRAQFELSSEDKLLGLLRRYVNRDAEAIAQMSTQNSPDAGKAGR